MATWFECKVTYEKIAENGIQKKTTEPYLVDALSFTEAETIICDKCQAFATGNFMVASVKRCKFSDVLFNEEGDRWYKCKVAFESIDEERGIEKKISQTLMAQASSLEDALAVVKKAFSTSIMDYTITSITETMILDVFKYEPTEKQ